MFWDSFPIFYVVFLCNCSLNLGVGEGWISTTTSDTRQSISYECSSVIYWTMQFLFRNVYDSVSAMNHSYSFILTPFTKGLPYASRNISVLFVKGDLFTVSWSVLDSLPLHIIRIIHRDGDPEYIKGYAPPPPHPPTHPTPFGLVGPTAAPVTG